MDLYESKEHSNNLAHFSAFVQVAHLEGALAQKEERLLKSLAKKLQIDDQEYAYILKNPAKYPIYPPSNSEKRLRRIFDMFQIIFADHHINESEKTLVYQYAVQLGYSKTNVERIIDRAVQMFAGEFEFEDFEHFVKR